MSGVQTRVVLGHRALEPFLQNLVEFAVLVISRHANCDFQDEHDEEKEEESTDHARALLDRTTATEEGNYEHYDTHDNP